MIHRDSKTLADLPFHVAERFPLRAVLHHCLQSRAGGQECRRSSAPPWHVGGRRAGRRWPALARRRGAAARCRRTRPTLAPFETIERFALIPTEFTVAGAEITPTMKVKRRVVEDRWRTVIEPLYEEGERSAAGLTT
jgi:hypothetical protein